VRAHVHAHARWALTLTLTLTLNRTQTISCVLMFTLMRAEFPVDTHVWHIAKKMGWVPPAASRETTYLHLNERVPDEVKYDLHVLLVDHGKRCVRCAKKGRLQKEEQGPCPL
jgi:endonuclease-3